PIAGFNALFFHVVNESILPLLVNRGSDVAPHLFFRCAGFVWPIHIAAELSDDDGVVLITQEAEVFFPAFFHLGGVSRDIDLALFVSSFVAFKFSTASGHVMALNVYRRTIGVGRNNDSVARDLEGTRTESVEVLAPVRVGALFAVFNRC